MHSNTRDSLPFTVTVDETESLPRMLFATQVYLPVLFIVKLIRCSVPVSLLNMYSPLTSSSAPLLYHLTRGGGKPVALQVMSALELLRVVRLLPTLIEE